jgi:rubrerythrin
MTIEEAIKEAITLEARIRDVYREAQEATVDRMGKRVFGVLADEEQGHLDYLQVKLDEWKRAGTVTVERLTSAIPSQQAIEAQVGKVGARVAGKDRGGELEMLTRAFDVEVETSEFYKQMARELPAEGQQLFAGFVKIEEGHVALVRAELDYLTKTGYWFDFKEFDME